MEKIFLFINLTFILFPTAAYADEYGDYINIMDGGSFALESTSIDPSGKLDSVHSGKITKSDNTELNNKNAAITLLGSFNLNFHENTYLTYAGGHFQITFGGCFKDNLDLDTKDYGRDVKITEWNKKKSEITFDLIDAAKADNKGVYRYGSCKVSFQPIKKQSQNSAYKKFRMTDLSCKIQYPLSDYQELIKLAPTGYAFSKLCPNAFIKGKKEFLKD